LISAQAAEHDGNERSAAVIVAHAKFLRLGVKSYLYILEGGWHSAPLSAQGTAEGDAVLSYIARWFSENLSR
jgi:hypothetical protein